MKFYLTNFGKNNAADNNIVYMLNFIPKYFTHEIVDNIEEADVVLFIHTYQLGYFFEPPKIENKPIVILDYVETDANLEVSHFIGFYPTQAIVCHDEYNKLHLWLQSHKTQIKAYFKRELLINGLEIPIPTYSIDFIGAQEWYWKDTTTSFDEFTSRKNNIVFIWGLSNVSRPILHGEMMKHYGGEYLCLNEKMLQENNINQRVVLFYKPWYMRMPFNDMMEIYDQGKIGITMWGAGKKCFRDVEASFNCVMALQESKCQYSYPWTHGVNCIILPNKVIDTGYILIDEYKAIQTIDHYLNHREKLYEIYLNCKANCLNYRVDNYLIKYLIPKLEQVSDI